MTLYHLCTPLLLAAFISLSACSAPEPTTDIGTGSPKDIVEGILTESEPIDYDLVYEGILPCKDCGGIKTTLRLSTKDNKFSHKEEFLNTEIAPSVLLGHFNTERGFENDKDATLYILNDELPESEQLYFVRETGKNDLLLKLDNQKQRTLHTNFELKKVSK